jgi:hypothetical protein
MEGETYRHTLAKACEFSPITVVEKRPFPGCPFLSEQYIRRVDDLLNHIQDERKMDGQKCFGPRLSPDISTPDQTADRSEGTLGQFAQSDHSRGHRPPWKGRLSPLVPVGRTEARGFEWLSFDCSKSEPLSVLPNGFNPCGESPRRKGGSCTLEAYRRGNGSTGSGMVAHAVPRLSAPRAVVR